MEQLISEIENYCAKAGIAPQKLLRAVIGANWGQWGKWRDGSSSPTMAVADRIRAHIADDPSCETLRSSKGAAA
jgi:hypothetical protein